MKKRLNILKCFAGTFALVDVGVCRQRLRSLCNCLNIEAPSLDVISLKNIRFFSSTKEKKKSSNNFARETSKLFVNSSLYQNQQRMGTRIFCTSSLLGACLVSIKTSLSQISLFYRFLPFGVRGYKLPTPDFKYKELGNAIVVKDRNPKGKFKVIPSAKGIITIFIGTSALLSGDYDSFVHGDKRSIEARHAFISHLDEEVYYNISIVARKGKHNITLFYKNKELYCNKEEFTAKFFYFYC